MHVALETSGPQADRLDRLLASLAGIELFSKHLKNYKNF